MKKHVARKQLVREFDEGILLRIFVHLPPRSVAQCTIVCKFWNKVIESSSWLWRMLYLKKHRAFKATLRLTSLSCLQKHTPSTSNAEILKGWKSSAVQEEQCARLIFGSFSILPWKAHTGRVNCCRMMMDTIASGSSDRNIRIWSLKSRQCLEEYTLPKSASISDLEFDINKMIGIAGADIYVWRRGGKSGLLRHISGHNQWLYSMCHVDPEIFVGCEDGTIRTFDLYSGGCSLIMRQHTEAVTGVGVNADMHLLASCSRDATVKICDTLSGENVATLSSRASYTVPSCLQLLSDDHNKIVVGTACGRIRCWDMRVHQLLWESKVSNGAMTSMHHPPYGACIVSVGGLDGIIRVVDCVSGQVVQSIRRNTQHKKTVGCESSSGNANTSNEGFTSSNLAPSNRGGFAETSSHSLVAGTGNFRSHVCSQIAHSVSDSQIGLPNRNGPPVLSLRMGMTRLVSAHPDGTLALWQFGIP